MLNVKASPAGTDGHEVMDDALALALARAIRAERARAGLTQAQLAERLDINPVTVSQIETLTRRVYLDEIPSICQALDVTLDQLLFRASPEARRRLGFSALNP
jgi:transcriptional regulator with XRE-family HTH domain